MCETKAVLSSHFILEELWSDNMTRSNRYYNKILQKTSIFNKNHPYWHNKYAHITVKNRSLHNNNIYIDLYINH